jgi:hypothetical protein
VHINGESVKAITPEMITAPAKVQANSEKSLPVIPLENAIGAKIAAKVKVIAIIENAISSVPTEAAFDKV